MGARGAARELDVLDADPEPFEEAEARAVEEARHEARRAVHRAQHRLDLVPRQDDRQPPRTLRSRERVDEPERAAEHGVVEEEDRRERLVLRRRSDVPVFGQMREEGGDVPLAERGRVLRPPNGVSVEEAEAADPRGVGLIGPDGVVPDPTGGPDGVEEAWLLPVAAGEAEGHVWFGEKNGHPRYADRIGICAGARL